MVQVPQKVIATEVDAQEIELSSPRFDEAAAQMARPVVPLSEQVVSTPHGHSTNPGAQLSALLSGKGSWLMAMVVGLILTAGALAIGVTAYRRNQPAPTQSLIPVAEAVRMELNQAPRLRQQSVSSSSPESRLREPSSSSSPPEIPKTKPRVQRAARPASDGRPRARMVDSYVVRH